MLKAELKKRLIQENIPKGTYWLNDGEISYGEEFCLDNNNGTWEVYYSERGHKTDLQTFQFEDDACNYFYKELTKTLVNMGIISG